MRKNALLWERTVDPEENRDELSLTAVAFSHDGLQLAVGTRQGLVTFYRTETGERLRALDAHIGRITSLAFSRDDTLLATSSHDGTAALWRMASE